MAAKQLHPSANLHAGLSVEDAQALVSQHFEWLTRSENIHTLAVDWKTVRGKVTDRPALVFYVSEKKHVEKLTPHEIIPGQVKDDARKCMIDTDVIEMKSFELQAVAGGSKIAVVLPTYVKLQGKTEYGTLGVNMVYASASQLRLLTTAHLVNFDESTVGTTIYQSTSTGLTALFPVTGMFPVKKYTQPDPLIPTRSQVDVLWANVTDESKISKAIVPPDKIPAGTRKGVKDDIFTLSGASTGFHDNVKVTNAAVATRLEDTNADGTKYYTFWEKLMMYDAPTQGGDSGAALLAKNDNKVIGLHMAGNGVDEGLGCQLHPVVDLP